MADVLSLSSPQWQREVFPHTEPYPLTSDLWVVQGEFPKATLPRNMIVYRFHDDQLLLHSVVAMNETAMLALESLGRPAIMVIPHWDHWAHIVAFKQRYPDIDVVCPGKSKAKVELRLPVEHICEQYFPRHGMQFQTPAGMEPWEGVLELPLSTGKIALVMNDLITHVPHQPGCYGKLLRLTGSTGRPRVIPPVRLNLKVKRHILKQYFQRLSRRDDIAVITTSHGICITDQIQETLQAVADDLG